MTVIGTCFVSSAHAQKKEASPDGWIAGGAANCFVSNCPTDINGNATVNVQDLLEVIGAWGNCPAPCAQSTCAADVAPAGGNCVVNVQDLLAIIGAWGNCPPPPNDNCGQIDFLNQGTTAFCTINATTDGPPQPTCGFCCNDPQIHKDIWFTYGTSAVASNSWLELSTSGSPFDTKIAVYQIPGNGQCVCPVQNMNLVACNDDIGDGSACTLNSRVRFQLQNLSCYLIRVGGYNGDSGPGIITSRGFQLGDECFNAIDLGQVTSVNTLTASNNNGFDGWTNGTIVTQAPCTPFNDGRDIWYKFTLGCGGNLLGSADTCDPFTNFDTIVTLYRGTCDGLILVGCNDDSNFAPCLLNGLPRKSSVDLPNPGLPGTFYARVSGYQGATGNFKLRIGLSFIN